MSDFQINTSLIYLSRSNVIFDTLELRELEATSMQRNYTINVHGILISRGSRFLQYLEGPDEPLNALMDCIARDERHNVQTVIYTGRRSFYRFADWHMRVLHDDTGELETWADSLTVALKLETPTKARALATSIVEQIADSHG